MFCFELFENVRYIYNTLMPPWILCMCINFYLLLKSKMPSTTRVYVYMYINKIWIQNNNLLLIHSNSKEEINNLFLLFNLSTTKLRHCLVCYMLGYKTCLSMTFIGPKIPHKPPEVKILEGFMLLAPDPSHIFKIDLCLWTIIKVTRWLKKMLYYITTELM